MFILDSWENRTSGKRGGYADSDGVIGRLQHFKTVSISSSICLSSRCHHPLQHDVPSLSSPRSIYLITLSGAYESWPAPPPRLLPSKPQPNVESWTRCRREGRAPVFLLGTKGINVRVECAARLSRAAQLPSSTSD